LQLEQSFNRINEEKRRAEEDFRARLESNNGLIGNLRKETDEQRNMLNDRKKQNADLNGELDRQRAALNEKNVEIQRSKHDMAQLQDMNQSLNN